MDGTYEKLAEHMNGITRRGGKIRRELDALGFKDHEELVVFAMDYGNEIKGVHEREKNPLEKHLAAALIGGFILGLMHAQDL